MNGESNKSDKGEELQAVFHRKPPIKSATSEEFIPWILGIPFLGFVYAIISAAAWEMFVESYQDVPSIYVLAGAWAVILTVYFKSQEGGLEKLKELCGFTFMAFLYAMGSLVMLGMLLMWVLEINIGEMDYTYRLVMLVWAGWIIGLRLYYKNKYDKQQ